MGNWLEKLKEMGAGPEMLKWFAACPTLQEAWDACKRGDWMLWCIGQGDAGEAGSPEHRKLVLLACACERLALLYVQPGDESLLKDIELTEAWAREEVSLDQVRDAFWTAWDTWAAGAVSWPASWVARAAALTAWNARAASRAARAARVSWASGYTAGASAFAVGDATLRASADIVRRYYPVAPSLKGG